MHRACMHLQVIASHSQLTVKGGARGLCIPRGMANAAGADTSLIWILLGIGHVSLSVAARPKPTD